MDQATQQNAALVEESAAAAESMKVQAQQLVQAVAVFKLASTAASSMAQPVVAHTGGMTTPDGPRGHERRGPSRAKNVVRPGFKASPQSARTSGDVLARQAIPSRTGTDNWESF
jgi:hypothetical protein